MLRKFYKDTIRGKLFNKIFLLYTLVVVLALCIMASIIYKNLQDSAQNESIEYNNMVIREVNNYFDKKINVTKTVLQGLYLNNKYRDNIIKSLEIEPEIYSAEYSSFKQSIYEYLSMSALYDESLQDIIVLNCSNNELYSYTKKQRKAKSTVNQEIVDMTGQAKQNFPRVKVVPAFYPYIISQSYSNEAFWNQNGVFTVESYIRSADSARLTGILLLNFSLSSCHESFSRLASKYESEITVMTEDGYIIYNSKNQYDKKSPKDISYLEKLSSGSRVFRDKVMGIDTSAESGVIVMSSIALDTVNKSLDNDRRTLLFLLFLCILLTTVLTYLVISHYGKRVDKIIRTIKKVDSGNLDARIHLKEYDDEMGLIAISFNHMCDNLKAYIDKFYVASLKQKDAELYALQSQINPHFLYNTLEVIRMRAVSNGSAEVGRMIRLLGELFRLTLKKSVIISFREEFEYCHTLLELYNFRYGGILNIELNLMEEVLDYGTPRHILQPLIENAIIHGIEPEQADGKVILSAEVQDGIIIVKVIDNGKGIEPDKLKEIKDQLEKGFKEDPGDSIGIFNVNSRLRLIFGDQYGLTIDSNTSEGVVTKVTMPAKLVGELSEYVQNHVGG